MIQISINQVLNQLKADLIGKDSYRGVSLSYSWLANQFGHFSLGFFIALILHFISFKIFGIQVSFTLLQSIIGSAVIWTIFESYNFLGPLLFNQSSKKIKLNPHDSYTFKPEWLNVGFDTFTDLLYFYLGALFLSLFNDEFPYLDYCFYSLLILILIPGLYWYKTKIILQSCKFPEQIRLSQWKFDLTEEQKMDVLNFISNSKNNTHLIITGKLGVGKTTLSIGIGTELAIKRHKISYFTAMKLSPILFEPDSITNSNGIWNWNESDCLIIDDINPSEPIHEDWIKAQDFYNYIYNPTENRDYRLVFKQRKIIWLIGKNSEVESWKSMLVKLGVDSLNICLLDLKK